MADRPRHHAGHPPALRRSPAVDGGRLRITGGALTRRVGAIGARCTARTRRHGQTVAMYTSPPSFTTRPTLTGTFGMSASTHWLATATAQAVLERGGNA